MSVIRNTPSGDRCALLGPDNDPRYTLKKKKTKKKQSSSLHWYIEIVLSQKKDALSWARATNRDQFKVTMSSKVYSHHFAQGCRSRL